MLFCFFLFVMVYIIVFYKVKQSHLFVLTALKSIVL